MEISDVFFELSAFPRWVPYRLIYNPKREKFDKIPHNGRSFLSTKDPNDWQVMIDALELVGEKALSGVGFVLTGGVTHAGWCLLGADFDKVDFEHFVLPWKSYAEISPSGEGVRSFLWVPQIWAELFRDTTSISYEHCQHVEVYIGTAPRFLTVTFNPLNEEKINSIDGNDLRVFESWLKLAETVTLDLPKSDGKPASLDNFGLSEDQQILVGGRGNLDRSKILHGLLIKLIDSGISQEDTLATVTQTPALWQYCLDHRHNSPARALVFAQHEVARAFDRSLTAKRAKLTGFNEFWKVPDITPAAEPEDLADFKFPMEIYDKAPGLIREISRWIIGASFAPREEFAYASTLVMMACLIGPYYTQGTRDGKCNLYITLVGETGTGKNEAIDTMGMLMAATEARDCVLDFPASEAAMRRQLNLTPNILLRIDELAHKLDSMKNSSNGSALGRAVLEAYNGARMPPKVYADEKKTLPAVENPFVQILGGTTDKVWDVVKSSHMEDGTLNRFVFVCLPENPPYRHNPEPCSVIPKSLKDRLNAFWRDGRRFDLIGYTPQGFGRKIEYEDDVKKAVDVLDLISWDKQQHEYGSLYSRLTQNTLKVAAILAISASRQKINMQDFEQAKKFIEWSIANTHRKISKRLADSNFERQLKRLMSKIAEERGKLAMREAYKYMHISRREMEELVTTLILSGEIEVVKENEPIRGGYLPEWLVLVEADIND